MKRLFLVEEQTVFREMLAEILKRENYAIIGQSGNGQHALKEILASPPDVVIINPMLPGLNGLELLKRLKRQLRRTRFLMFSGSVNSPLVKETLEAGAHGFVEKSAGLHDFLTGLEVIANGGTYFGPSISEMLRSFVANPDGPAPGKDPLTAREREVLQLIAEGNRTKEIAALLELSVKTIDNHRTNMMRKLGLHNIASITRYAIENGMIEVETLT